MIYYISTCVVTSTQAVGYFDVIYEIRHVYKETTMYSVHAMYFKCEYFKGRQKLCICNAKLCQVK